MKTAEMKQKRPLAQSIGAVISSGGQGRGGEKPASQKIVQKLVLLMDDIWPHSIYAAIAKKNKHIAKFAIRYLSIVNK